MPFGVNLHRHPGARAWRAAAALAALALLSGGATAGARADDGAATRTLVFFGDSLTAGYGLLIGRRIEAAHLPWQVVNAGVSGETSAGGLRRIDWVLRQRVDLFVLELGANDGLRGTDPAVTRANLQAIIDRVRSRYPDARIVLAGMRMPASMGPD
jgi:acyl-CoA thioesterase-1